MPNSFLHLLSLHPKYSFMKKNLIHFNQSANPKAHGEGLVRRVRHLMGHGGLINKHINPSDPHILTWKGDGLHKHRRPAPLRFKL